MKYLTLLVLALLSLPTISSSCAPASSIDDSIVQVWEPADTAGGEGTLLAFGVAVGDGSQVLTVINYGDYTPDGLEVVLPGKGTYQASIKAIDPRTSATLLRLEGVKLPPAKIADTSAIEPLSEVIVHGWYAPDYNVLGEQTGPFLGFDFSSFFPVEPQFNGFVAWDGAVVTDNVGAVIGLISTIYSTFYYPPSIPPATAAPIIDIQSALELLSQDAVNQPWAKGPVDSIYNKKSGTHYLYINPPLAKYNEIALALRALLGTMGEPLPEVEIPVNYLEISRKNPSTIDGTLLSVLYAYPIKLWNAAGHVLAEARWVGIQWGRSEGKPNRLFYGYIDRGNAIVEGGFTLNGDITELEKTLHP